MCARGCSTERGGRTWCPSISSAGVRPVVQCGVTQYCRRNYRKAKCFDFFSSLTARFMACLKTPTSRSASPFDAGLSGVGHLERSCRQVFRLIWAGFGTSRAVLAVGSNVDLDVRPPHMHTCERLHALLQCASSAAC